ncbi:MAG TPA: zf-HC2 domain-containing protein [Pyrinomonadaceae bacterium]|nr:zf-HC2 domain-containing protein [Pyrinomonadaceae bacterium]
MTEHLSDTIIGRYLRHELDDMGRRQADAHLSTCSSCLGRVSGAESELAVRSLTEALLPHAIDVDEPFHLSTSELENFARGNADQADRIICESHLEACEECSNELKRLSTSKPVIPVQPARWQRWSSPTPARIAAAIALIAFITLLVLLWRQQPRLDETAKTGTTPTPIPTASPTPTNLASPAESPTDTDAIAQLKDNGREIRLNRTGTLTGGEAFDNETQQMMKRVLSGGQLSKPKALSELEPNRITLLGGGNGDEAFVLIGPLGQVIETDRPTLKWQPLKGASSYVVSIYDRQFKPVAQSPPLTQTTWVTAAPLPRGETLFWEVVAMKDGKGVTAPVAPKPRAEFRVLATEQSAELTKLRGLRPVSHFALGLACARFGLINEAIDELTQLSKENPDSAEARRLLTEVRRWQR